MTISLHFISLLMTALIALKVSVVRAQEVEGGEGWSRIIRHPDGTLTKSIKHTDKHEIFEEKYDAGKVLVAKRRFLMDAQDRLLSGTIFDAKGRKLATIMYGYSKQTNTINEERMLNAKGQVVQRKFPPGTLDLQKFPTNAKHTLVFYIDPENPNTPARVERTTERPVRPVNSAEDDFVPGIPGGGGGVPSALSTSVVSPTNEANVPARPTRGSFFRRKER